MPVTVRLYSDYVCPYCYVAEQATVPKLEATYDIAVDWRGFQLHPDIPEGGVAVEALLGRGRAAAKQAGMKRFAREFGVEIGAPERVPNTLRALALTEYARDCGVMDAFRELAMAAHWHDGRDIEADEVLGDLAAQVGLDAEQALSAADDPAYRGRVEALREEAHERMVSGIPTFFLGDYMVVGCQTFETFERCAQKAGLPKKT